MTNTKGFTIDVSSRYEGWWRYNVALMCGCFDAAGERTGFASMESHVAEIGVDLTQNPVEMDSERRAVLETEACDHLLLYIYIVPHTLPSERSIDASKPFEIEIQIAYNGQKLRTQTQSINQWSGASIEMPIDKSNK